MTAAGTRTATRPPAALGDLLWFRLPQRLVRVSATLARVTMDGGYLGRTPAGAVAPAVALAVGLLLGAVHPGPAFSRSSLVMMALLGLATASAGLGLLALAGYAVADIALHAGAPAYGLSPAEALLQQRAPLLISYAVLGFALTIVPATATALRDWARAVRLLPDALRPLVGATAGAVVAGAFTYAWAKAAAVLVRPVFTWAGGQPSVPDIAPLQERTWWLVAAVVVVALARGLVEEGQRQARRVDPRTEQLALAVALRIFAVDADPVRRTLVSVAVGVGMAVALSGMIAGIGQGVAVALFLVAVLLVRDALQRWDHPLVRLVERVPVLVRVAGAFVVGRIVGEVILGWAWTAGTGNTFTPLLVSVCLWVALMTLVSLRGVPPEVARFQRDQARRRA